VNIRWCLLNRINGADSKNVVNKLKKNISWQDTKTKSIISKRIYKYSAFKKWNGRRAELNRVAPDRSRLYHYTHMHCTRGVTFSYYFLPELAYCDKSLSSPLLASGSLSDCSRGFFNEGSDSGVRISAHCSNK
jgi:hypothetical protein